MNTQQFFDNKTLGCGHRVKVRYGDSIDFNGNGYIQEVSLDTNHCSIKLDENPHNWGIDGVITLPFQPDRVLAQDKITMSSPNDEDLLEMEEEKEFCNYGEKDGIIQVAGGGMMNGNAYATVELKNGKYWYCEYGKDPLTECRGNKLVYDDEGCFDIIEEEPQIIIDLRAKLAEVSVEPPHTTKLRAELAKLTEEVARDMDINAKLKADLKRLKDENKRLEDANRDYYLTGKGLKRLNRVEDENRALQIKMGGLLATVEEYKNQAIQNIIDIASLTEDLDIFKAKVVANIL